jgi:hypothetical protein
VESTSVKSASSDVEPSGAVISTYSAVDPRVRKAGIVAVIHARSTPSG